MEDRLKLSKSFVAPLKIEDFPSEHLQKARIVLETPLYKFINDEGIEIIVTNDKIDEYAKSLFELYNALLNDLEIFQIETTPEYK